MRYKGFSAGAALAEAVAVSVPLEDVDVMGETVEQRLGQALGAEGFGPFVEREVEVMSVAPRS